MTRTIAIAAAIAAGFAFAGTSAVKADPYGYGNNYTTTYIAPNYDHAPSYDPEPAYDYNTTYDYEQSYTYFETYTPQADTYVAPHPAPAYNGYNGYSSGY